MAALKVRSTNTTYGRQQSLWQLCASTSAFRVRNGQCKSALQTDGRDGLRRIQCTRNRDQIVVHRSLRRMGSCQCSLRDSRRHNRRGSGLQIRSAAIRHNGPERATLRSVHAYCTRGHTSTLARVRHVMRLASQELLFFFLLFIFFEKPTFLRLLRILPIVGSKSPIFECPTFGTLLSLLCFAVYLACIAFLGWLYWIKNMNGDSVQPKR